VTVVGRQEYAWWRACTTAEAVRLFAQEAARESHPREAERLKPTSDCRCGAEMVARPCAAFWPGAPKQAPSSGVLWPNETMDLEQTIDALVYRKKAPWISTAPNVSSSIVSSQACATPVTRPAASSRIWISTGALFVALSPHRPRQSCDKSCRSVDQDLPANKTAPNHFIARHAGEGASCCFHGKA
jgi:hypothetical protein